MPKNEQTLVLIKPDGVQRGLVGEILRRFERKGFKIVALKILTPSKELAEKHYNKDDKWCEEIGRIVEKAYKAQNLKFKFKNYLAAGQMVLKQLRDYIRCGPVVAVVLRGGLAVEHVRKLVGHRDPLRADVGTIRGDLTIESALVANAADRTIRNMIHASGTVEEAKEEIKLWFKPAEICDYELAIEQILYDPEWERVKEDIIDAK